MNIYQLLEEIMEALADGRQEGESTDEYRDRKAAELKKIYTDRKEEAKTLQRAYDKQAKKAKREYKRTPNEDNVQKWAEMQNKATDTAFKGADAQTKEFKVDKIKSKIDWRKQMSEALEILEDIYSAIDKKYPKNSERNKELKDSAYKSKADAEEVAKEHELGKRPEPAPMKGGWDIMSVEIPDETPEEKEYAKKEWKYDLKQMKKEITKNKAGEHETSKKQFPKSYKDVGTLGEPDAKELETERVARKAAGKRKAKMNKNEALEILEDLKAEIQKQPEGRRAELQQKLAKAQQKEGKGHYERHQDMLKHASKQEKGDEKTKERSEEALRKYEKAVADYTENTPSLYQFEALEILEDIHAAIEKHAHEIKKPRLHRDAIDNYVDELVGVAKKNLPDEKKHLMSATNDEMNKVEAKRQNTKNKVGERKTDLRSAGVKGGDYWRVKDQRKGDAAKGYPKAIEKSVKRHEKKMSEALDIIEAIIDENNELKNKLADKFAPAVKAERRHLDKEIKKGEKALSNVKKCKEVSQGCVDSAQKDLEKAEEKVWTSAANNFKGYEEAAKERKAAAKEVGEWKKDVRDLTKREDDIKKTGHTNAEKRNELNRKVAGMKDKADKVTDKTFNEALEIIEAIIDYADNLFELDYEEKQNISPNKISRTKKDKDGEKVEVVSVADELFPYEGSAKEQFNKKVLDKINAMIEGKGSLEDLIQFVRAGVKARAHESLDEGKEPNKECEYRKAKWEEANQKYFDTKKKHLDWESKHPETRKAYDEERKAYADLEKAREDAKKISYPYHEAMEVLEGILDRFKKENKDPVYNNPISKDLRGKKAELDRRNDEFMKHAERAEKATGYRKQVHQEMAADADRAASQANKEYRHAKGEVLDAFRKRGASNPQAHKMLSRMMGEGLEELLQTIEGLYTNEAKNIFGKETDRGSLEDDISTTLTGKTLNQHIEGAVKKVIEPKKEA